ncbi:MAG: AtpZ/AtpI family protein [Bacteroidota bacterium]
MEPTNEDPKNNPTNSQKNNLPNGNTPKGIPPKANHYMKYSGMAFQLIAGIILGIWLGSMLDKRLEMKTPLFTIGLSLLFMIGSLVLIIRDLMKGNE